MRIKDLRQSATPQTFLVLCEDGTKLRAGAQLIAQYDIAPGRELPETQWNEFLEDARRWAARERALRIAAATNISKKKLGRRLVEKGERPEDAEAAVAWLDELHLLDDARTGETIVHSALQKGYGAARIRQILREKEIPREYWEDLLADLPPMDGAIDALLHKKLKHQNPDQKEIQRAVDALLRYGHTWQDIKAGLERFHADAELEEPECQ